MGTLNFIPGMAQQRRALQTGRWLPALALSLALAACGGGGGAGGGDSPAGDSPAATGNLGNPDSAGSSPDPLANPGDNPAPGVSGVDAQATGVTRGDAFRLLTQASFGPTEADLQRVMSLGFSGWVDEQLAKPARSVHWTRWLADDAQIKLTDPRLTAGANSVVSSFYQQALQADDQLRQRVAFALSQIFVVSLVDLHGYRAESVASWQDMLTRNALGNFRTLMEDATLHPAMGQYLSSLGSRKEDPATGRIADQNYARELMQLFSIGLVQLNLDGSPRLDSKGNPVETYGPDDIVGLSKAFTGMSWATTTPGAASPIGLQYSAQRMGAPMQRFSAMHSISEKRFLGSVIAAQGAADADASRRSALDTLFRHPNVGPFISRQLIQRLVTSHPSPAYVARVAGVFNNNGLGVRGDLKAVVRALLLDDEARNAAVAAGGSFGKIREPVLRLTSLLRAYNARSLSGPVVFNAESDPGSSIGQAPLSAPSVFNFYRPGYIPPGGPAEALSMTVPELQSTSEVSVAGYANAMAAVLSTGAGKTVLVAGRKQPDVQLDYSADQALADDANALTAKVFSRLLTRVPSPSLKAQVTDAVNSVAVPKLLTNGSNQARVAEARLNRLRIALMLTLVSPEYLVQK